MKKNLNPHPLRPPGPSLLSHFLLLIIVTKYLSFSPFKGLTSFMAGSNDKLCQWPVEQQNHHEGEAFLQSSSKLCLKRNISRFLSHLVRPEPHKRSVLLHLWPRSSVKTILPNNFMGDYHKKLDHFISTDDSGYLFWSTFCQ